MFPRISCSKNRRFFGIHLLSLLTRKKKQVLFVLFCFYEKAGTFFCQLIQYCGSFVLFVYMYIICPYILEPIEIRTSFLTVQWADLSLSDSPLVKRFFLSRARANIWSLVWQIMFRAPFLLSWRRKCLQQDKFPDGQPKLSCSLELWATENKRKKKSMPAKSEWKYTFLFCEYPVLCVKALVSFLRSRTNLIKWRHIDERWINCVKKKTIPWDTGCSKTRVTTCAKQAL